MKKGEIKLLLEMAKKVRKNAYSPYFNFNVGAALLAEDGTIYVGCNVENVSGAAITCAEPNALGAAIAAGRRKFTALAVVGSADVPIFPCGVCRQKLMEFSPNLDVYAATIKGKVAHQKLKNLLPRLMTL